MSPSISSPWAKVVAAVVQLLLCLLLLATPEQSLQSQSASHTSRQAVVNKKWQMRSEIFWEISAIKGMILWPDNELRDLCREYAMYIKQIHRKQIYWHTRNIGKTLCKCAALVGSKQTNKQDIWSGACMQVTLVNALPILYYYYILSRSTACIVKLFCCQWLIIPHANAC